MSGLPRMRSGVALVLLACAGGACQPAHGESGAGPVPDEIRFDHTIHAGTYRIPCLLCHSYADKAKVAGIPSLRKCMGCHELAPKEKPALQKLAELFKQGKPLSFTRVHEMPDHVYFSHRMHVRAQVACGECHGSVETMHVVRQVASLEMGWCLDCHTRRGASLDCLTCHK